MHEGSGGWYRMHAFSNPGRQFTSLDTKHGTGVTFEGYKLRAAEILTPRYQVPDLNTSVLGTRSQHLGTRYQI